MDYPWYLPHVELAELSSFFRNVAVWPRTENELSAVAENVCKVLNTAFAAIYSAERGEKFALSFGNFVNTSSLNLPVFNEFVKRQIRHHVNGDLSGTQVKHISVPYEFSPQVGKISVQSMTVAAIAAEMKLDSPRGGKRPCLFGYVAAGSFAPLGKEQEVALVSMAERLSSLALIAQYEEALKLRGQFLSIASHELKTPLTSIYGILQLQERMIRLKKDEPGPEQQERQHSFLKMVIRQVERLNELIDGLLDLARIQNGRFMVEPTEADVAAVVKEAVSSRLSVIAEEAGVKLHLDTPPTLKAFVDPVRMEEVVTNLVMNAIRFSPEGGVVWIRLTEDGTAFRLIVRDQGPDLPIEDRERIFQPFERAQRTGRLGGLGLGLFISRQIAQLHGGNVSLVESVPGKGNVLEAHFPLRGEAAAISA